VILAVSKRWHLWRHRLARWLLRRVMLPVTACLDRVARSAGTSANEQRDKARIRYAICERCPNLNREFSTCRLCTCYMPAKVEMASATCPQSRW